MNQCPKCGAPLAERRNKRTGSVFLGCTAYPACKFAIDPERARAEATRELITAIHELTQVIRELAAREGEGES